MAHEGHPMARRLDRVLSGDYLAELPTAALDRVRALERDAAQEETDLSYLRRLVQGRMDIVRAELTRRAGGGEGSLLADLPKILAGDTARPAPRGLGRHQDLEPSRVGEHRRYVESLVDDAALSDVGALSDDDLRAAIERLEAAEAEVSELRHRVHAVLDACAAEIMRRYRDGEADVADLLAPRQG